MTIAINGVGPKPPGAIRLVFGGDFCLYEDGFEQTRGCLAGLQPLLPDMDLGLLNFEGPVVEGEPERRAGVHVHLRNSRRSVEVASAAGFHLFNLANNHTMDFGRAGLESTLQSIEQAGCRCFGAGLDAVGAGAPAIVECNGRRIGFLGYTSASLHVGALLAAGGPGCASLDQPGVVLEAVARLKREVDLVCVVPHWGHEFYQYPAAEQVALARAMVDAGAGLVIGHHPHVVQGVERYHDSIIAYSLGNLFLPRIQTRTGRMQWEKSLCRQFMILAIDLGPGDTLTVSVLGGEKEKQNRLIPATGTRGERFLQQVRELSEPLENEDYSRFWAAYADRRARELRRETLREAGLKLFHTPPGQLLKTLSWADVTRNLRRLAR